MTKPHRLVPIARGFFGQRHHWAWIALTILSFNRVASLINFFNLRKRWTEDSVATPTI
jgi:hypothetical protein